MDQPLTAQAGEDGTVATRLLQGCLPPGWHLLGRARHGNRAPGATPSGCHLLCHADRGVALLDIAPDATPNAEARLRRTLAAAGFARAFPGRLPVWHERLELAQLPRLGTLLGRAFEQLPPLALPRGGAWVAAVEDAIAADPAWAPTASAAAPVGEAPLPEPAIPDPWPKAVPQPRRGLRAGLLAAGLILIFGMGWAVGRLVPAWQEAPAAPRPAGEADAAPAAPVLHAQPDALLPPTSAAIDTHGDPTELPSPRPAHAAEDMPATAPPQSAPLVAVPLPEPASEATPPLPPEPVAAPPPRVVRPRAPAYDRACGEAQFRWQRGETLTAAEMAHIHTGCGPTRLR